jgi:hypothetical protein
MVENDCIVTDHSDPGARPGFSRKRALSYLNEIDNKLEKIVSIALASIAYEARLIESARNCVLSNLFLAIKEQAGDETTGINELRKMLEALPEGG